MLLRITLILISTLTTFAVSAQVESPTPTTPEAAEAKYAKNIKKSRINGVYIPKDEVEAIKELKEISPEASLAKFRTQSEDMVVKKLHFGLGRWIRYNWNFYEGSRLGEHLKTLGVSHPDDMSTFLMILLHRDLNGNSANQEEIINTLKEKRRIKNGGSMEIETIKTTKKTSAPK